MVDDNEKKATPTSIPQPTLVLCNPARERSFSIYPKSEPGDPHCIWLQRLKSLLSTADSLHQGAKQIIPKSTNVLRPLKCSTFKISEPFQV